MDNLRPVSDIDPSELPEGFSTVNPTTSASASSQSQQAQEQKQAILEQALTSDALARLGRIKLVKPDKAARVEAAIVTMAMSGKLAGGGLINEARLIELLERSNANSSSNSTGGTIGATGISIQRKKYAFDSDEEDDGDEDLMG